MMDATVASGLGVPTLPHTGFGVALADIDNDGYRDVAVANGRVRKAPGMATVGSGFTAAYGEANFLAVNDGAGRFRSGREDRSLPLFQGNMIPGHGNGRPRFPHCLQPPGRMGDLPDVSASARRTI